MKQKFKIIFAILLAIASVSVLIELSYHLFPSQEGTLNLIILPIPASSPNTTFDNKALQSLQLDVELSQGSNSTEKFMFNITQGSSMTIDLVLSSFSNDTEFTIPLYLSVGAIENQPFAKMIVSAPSPYPALPWPSHEDSPNATKPFEASFNPNPLTLEPEESKKVTLTINALEDAPIGKYSMFVEMGNWEQTRLGAITFQLTVMPKQ